MTKIESKWDQEKLHEGKIEDVHGFIFCFLECPSIVGCLALLHCIPIICRLWTKTCESWPEIGGMIGVNWHCMAKEAVIRVDSSCIFCHEKEGMLDISDHQFILETFHMLMWETVPTISNKMVKLDSTHGGGNHIFAMK